MEPVTPGRAKLEAKAFLSAILAAALSITAALPGCGTNVNTPLPDLKTKSEVPEGGVKPKSSAEQKAAIDELMAKRDRPR